MGRGWKKTNLMGTLSHALSEFFLLGFLALQAKILDL